MASCGALKLNDITQTELEDVVIEEGELERKSIQVVGVLDQVDQYVPEAPETGGHGLFQRLISGNMFLSKRTKSHNYIKGLAKGSSSISRQSFKVTYHHKPDDSQTDCTAKTLQDICEYILECLIDINYETLVQEKWLTETKRLLKNKILTIGVFGRHKAGKSTVLNALLHQDILPSAVKNETATLTEIHHDNTKHIGIVNDCLKENCPACPAWKKITGCKNIKRQLHEVNTSIREGKNQDITLQYNAVYACLPLISNYTTDDMRVVLMDTPGLAEANELGITDIAEHQLMTCSAYIYVISCTQLEDEIDTETLRAIVERDPEIFIEKRMLIAVTKLDEYEKTDKCEEADDDSDTEDEPNKTKLYELIWDIKKTVQHQFALICPIPDECIIPVSAKGALEARKVMHGVNSDSIDEIMLRFKKRTGKTITVEVLDECSQISLLEKRIGSNILSVPNEVWKHAIIRDCWRYLNMAISELEHTEETHRMLEKDFHSKFDNKEKIWNELGHQCYVYTTEYRRGAKFHKSLESAYDNDIKSHHLAIEEKCEKEFNKFEEKVKKIKNQKAQDYRNKCKEFLENANESLMSDFAQFKCKKVEEILKNIHYHLGKCSKELESIMIKFCDSSEKLEFDDEKEISIQEARQDTSTAPVQNTLVKSAPLELKDLLEHGKSVSYTMLEKFRIRTEKIFLNVKLDDPERKLLEIERAALLNELKASLHTDCKEYFQLVKNEIIDGYLDEHITKIEDQMMVLKMNYKDRINEVSLRKQFWHNSFEGHKSIADGFQERIELLKQLKAHLAPYH